MLVVISLAERIALTLDHHVFIIARRLYLTARPFCATFGFDIRVTGE